MTNYVLPKNAYEYQLFQKKWRKENDVVRGTYVRPDHIPTDEEEYKEYGFEYKMVPAMIGRIQKRCAMEITDIDDSGITLSDGYVYPYFILGLWNNEVATFGPSVLSSSSNLEIEPGDSARNPKREYRRKEAKWIKRNKVKKGSIVVATREANSHQDGWDNYWSDSMVTKQFLMVTEENESLNGPRDGFGVLCADGDGNSYWYPYFVLTFVK